MWRPAHFGVLCSNMHPGTPSWATAELALDVIAAARPAAADRGPERGEWQAGVGMTLRGKTLGVWVMAASARRWPAMRRRSVCMSSPTGVRRSMARAKADGFEAVADRAAFFEEAIVVSLHIRLNDKTRGIVTAMISRA